MSFILIINEQNRGRLPVATAAILIYKIPPSPEGT